MTGPEQYRQAQRDLDAVQDPTATQRIAMAQVSATLALVAVTALAHGLVDDENGRVAADWARTINPPPRRTPDPDEEF